MKSENLRWIIAMLFFLNVAFPGIAQQNQAVIKGSIFDEKGEPVMFATVVLYNQDSILINGSISKEDGSFLFAEILAGKYFIKIQNIAFKPYSSALLDLGINEQKSLPKITLAGMVNKLNEVVVATSKAMVEVQADKIIFNVASTPSASGNNGLELLAKAPGVILDPDNNIILQGKGGVQVFINGRPSRLSGTDLTNMLQTMRSDNIESIEIITNPSAKYEAEGNAGIINIKLKKNVNLGLNGNLLSSFSKGTYSRSSGGGSLNYRGEKLNFMADITLSDDYFLDNMIDIKNQSGYEFDQKSYSKNNRKGQNFSTGIEYNFNSKQSIEFTGRGIITQSDNRLNSNTKILSIKKQELGEILESETNDIMPSQNYNFNLNYQGVLSKNSNLSADLSLGKYVNNKSTDQPNDYWDTNRSSILRTIHNAFEADTKIDFWSSKVDYEKVFSKITLSTGAKYSFINTSNQFAFFEVLNQNRILDINKSNDFNYEEKVIALYMILNAKLSEKVKLNAGLRMENTASEGRLVSELAINNNNVVRNYTDFFPNIGLSYDDKKKSQLNIGIGRRITRPNYQDLNPFESRISELVAWKGNPFLKPNYAMNYSITYSYMKKLVISNTYSVTRDFFATVFEIVNDKGNFLIPRNMDKVISNGLSVSYPQRVAKWWETNTFINYSYSIYSGNLEGTVIDFSTNIFNVRVQNTIKLPGNVSMDVMGFYNNRMIWRGSVFIKPFYGVNLGLKKDFLNKKLMMTLTAADIFRGNTDYSYSSNYGGMVVAGVRTFDNQRVGITATYKFGNQKVKAIQKSKSGIEDEMNRISN